MSVACVRRWLVKMTKNLKISVLTWECVSTFVYRVNKTWVSDVKLWHLCMVFWILVVLRKYYFLYLKIFSCLYFQFILLPIWFKRLRLYPITKFQNIRVVPRGLVFTIFTTLTVTFGECTWWICKKYLHILNIFIASIG